MERGGEAGKGEKERARETVEIEEDSRIRELGGRGRLEKSAV